MTEPVPSAEDQATAAPDRTGAAEMAPSHELFDLDRAFRKPGLPALIVGLSCLFGIWHILTNLVLNEPGMWQNAIHFAGFAFLAAISQPLWRGSSRGGLWVLEWIFGIAIALSALWIAYNESGLYERTLAKTGQEWQFSTLDWVTGIIVIVGAVELTRRMTGWIIPSLVILALAYNAFLGEYLPGVFRAASLPVSDVMFRSLYNDEGMFGIITTISSANITLFMIFGAFLVISGASDFVIEVAKVIAGRFRGGAAFVAVIASALTGTISGSAVANTASTGVITIPLMKSNGFQPKFAAGVEASASTGGQLMPPIMGAGAFVMVSYTGIQYGTIVLFSIVPAILYFLSVAFVIRIEAVKSNIDLADVAKADRVKIAAGALNFVLPLGVLTYLLVTGRTPSFAACVAIATLVAGSWLTPNKMGPEKIARALTLGIRTSIMTAVLLVTVGLINNAVTTSGLANSFALMIAEWSQGSLIIALVLVALASLVLGMGLPVTAAYIVLSILSAPAIAGMLADGIVVDLLAAGIGDPAKAAMFALVDSPHAAKVAGGMTVEEARQLVDAIPFELAIVIRPALVDTELMTNFLLTAHLIVFWLSQDSNVTPPVCLAAFTAAGIAGSRPMATGVSAWKIAKGLYIVPLLFAYTPLVGGSFAEIMQVGIFSLFGIYAFNALIQRYAEGPLSVVSLPLLIAGCALSFWPSELIANLAGAVLVALAVIVTRRASRAPTDD